MLKAVDEGLTRFFGGHGALIVVSDGFSTDGTREVAAATPTQVEVVVLTQRGGPGKGVGVRTVLEEAQNRDARAVALVDGDLTSIRPEWLKLLLEPILAGAELVVPLYLRHPHDGVITNHVVYPLVNVLFGLGVRQPIGGEFELPLPLWVEGLYRAVLAYRDDPEGAREVLEPLWQGRYLSFVQETKGLPVAEAEARIQAQLSEFRRLVHLVREAL